ncbi:MAG: Gfo/Idh/MocA family oxidoreductase [Pseudomonadota bacterium]
MTTDPMTTDRVTAKPISSDPIRLGALGLGRGFALTARALAAHPGISLVAAATRSEAAQQAFVETFGGRVYAAYEALLADPAVELVYVATPHGLHREHVCAALRAGKHVVVEKPLAIRLADGAAMVACAEEVGRQLLVGPSHSYDPPVALAAQIIASGRLGAPKLLHGLMATDFLYRPRRPEELCTAEGGGVVFSQAIHHIDVAMRLLASPPVAVQAVTGAWDPARPTEGAYSALIEFRSGATASLTYSGYGWFDSDVWMEDVSELGYPTASDRSGDTRRRVTAMPDEAAQKKARAFSGLDALPDPTHHEHFGPVIVFCTRGDIRLTPWGVLVYDADGVEEIAAPFAGPRQGFAQALVDALRGGPRPVQTGRWGLTALRACHAFLQSARSQARVDISKVTDA